MPTLYSARAGAPGCRLVGFGHTTWGTSTKCHVSLATTEAASSRRCQDLKQHARKAKLQVTKNEGNGAKEKNNNNNIFPGTRSIAGNVGHTMKALAAAASNALEPATG